MKKFILKISYTILPVWIFFTGMTLYYHKCVEPEISGDLGKLSQLAFGHEYISRLRATCDTEVLFKTTTIAANADTSTCDVLTIGDSFAEMGAYGFQNYLCKYSDLRLSHIAGICSNPFSAAYYLLDNGLTDRLKVKHLVVTSVERSFLNRMLWFESTYPDLAGIASHTMTDINTSTKSAHSGNKIPENDFSMLPAKNWGMLRLGFSKSIYDCKLNSPLFTHNKYDKSLFFYKDDLQNLRINQPDEKVITEVLDKLFEKAKAKGVNLILLIAADKYDIYQPFIENNPYGPKTINEDLARIYPSPNIIISKFFLQPMLFDGEKDLYLVNDSHWSYKASQRVACEILTRIKSST